MSDTRVERLCAGVWAFDDANEDSFYLVEGETRALCIDTGAARGPLMPLLSRYTDKPIDLALTHAHIDHMYRAAEFEHVYLGGADFRAWRTLGPLYAAGHALYALPPRRLGHRRFRAIEEGHVFDLGGRSLTAISAPGHTPGSMLFALARDGLLFTGDAFGSGEAIWMWMPGCLTTSAYRDSLDRVLPKLAPYAQFRWLGGHRLQSVRGERHPHGRRLTIQAARDMRALCDEMLDGRAEGKRVRIVPFVSMRVYSLGDASMVVRRRQIR